MFGSAIRSAVDNGGVQRVLSEAPFAQGLIRRFVAGEDLDAAIEVAHVLSAQGLLLSLEYLADPVIERESAARVTDNYAEMLRRLAIEGLADSVEASLPLSAIGQVFDRHTAYDNAGLICEAAKEAGSRVTLEMHTHRYVDGTLDILHKLVPDYPDTGVVVQAYLKRTEGDIAELVGPGRRVRLAKGTYDEPESVAYQTRAEIDKSYVRCMNLLMSAECDPVFGTHDPRLITIAKERAAWHGRAHDSFEFEMLYGVNAAMRRRLVAAGYPVRVYVPYGEHWHRYFGRRLAERPTALLAYVAGRRRIQPTMIRDESSRHEPDAPQRFEE